MFIRRVWIPWTGDNQLDVSQVVVDAAVLFGFLDFGEAALAADDDEEDDAENEEEAGGES